MLKLRLIGNRKTIEAIVKAFDLQVKIYPSRYDKNDGRIYLELEDDFVKQKLANKGEITSNKQ